MYRKTASVLGQNSSIVTIHRSDSRFSVTSTSHHFIVQSNSRGGEDLGPMLLFNCVAKLQHSQLYVLPEIIHYGYVDRKFTKYVEQSTKNQNIHYAFMCEQVSCDGTLQNTYTNTIVSRKRAHGRSTLQVCQRGGWAFFRLFRHHESAPMSCLQQLEALEANNCTQNNIQRDHQRLQSQVLTAHNTPGM